jgi:integrase
MTYITKRNYKNKYSWQAQVKRRGHQTLTKSFSQKRDAEVWARAMERKLDQGNFSDYSEASKITVGELFKRYIREGKHSRKKDHANIEYRVKNFLNDTITDTNLLRLSTKHIAEFRDRKLEHWSPSTFNKHKSLLSIVIDTAMHDWDIYVPHNPCKSFKREKEARPRNRTLQGDEYDRLMKACERSKNPYLKAMVEFSLETAVRQGELLKMSYEDINMKNSTVLLRDTKNGEDRVLPLSDRALQILVSVPRNLYGKVFPISRDSLKFWWKLILKDADIKDFVWHDLRRSATRYLWDKGLNLAEIQLIGGWRDPRVLLNTYTKLDPVKIAKKL